MARPSKIEAAAINICIQEDSLRDYPLLLQRLAELKRGIKVVGEQFVAINYFSKDTGIGIISKYSEIDIDGEWFNIEDFDAASPEQLVEINVPNNLKPNLSQYYFVLNAELHLVVFQTYSASRALSAKSVEKYFKAALQYEEIVDRFGRVEADVIKSYDEVERILDQPYLKELRFIIRRPNPDDVSDELAAVIEERLNEQDADEYEEALKARGSHNLKPNERTRKLGVVAAENGQVKARSLTNGVISSKDTADLPLLEVDTYTSEEIEQTAFLRVAAKIFARVSSQRRIKS